MVLADNSYPLADAIWTMFVFFAWFVWLWLLFTVFSDLFRRRDVSGWGKFGWTVAVLVLPFFGVFAYLISQGRSMGERQVADRQTAQRQFDDYVRSVSGNGHSSAAEISQAKELLDSGAITPSEFETIKQKALAGAGHAH